MLQFGAVLGTEAHGRIWHEALSVHKWTAWESLNNRILGMSDEHRVWFFDGTTDGSDPTRVMPQVVIQHPENCTCSVAGTVAPDKYGEIGLTLEQYQRDQEGVRDVLRANGISVIVEHNTRDVHLLRHTGDIQTHPEQPEVATVTWQHPKVCTCIVDIESSNG